MQLFRQAVRLACTHGEFDLLLDWIIVPAGYAGVTRMRRLVQ